MIRLNTKLKNLERGPTIRIATLALRWCRDTLGVNNRKKYKPAWTINKGYDADIVGEYDDEQNEVFIYYGGIDDVKELIQTCIHEWTHQLQPITTKYYKYPGSYSRNPYERQARYNELKHYKPCWDHIKTKIKCKKQ